MSGVYLRDGDDLVPMRETPYEAESLLQELVAKHPELLAGDRESGVGGWLLVKREAGLAGGSLDHLFLDQTGVPTLVEVKRSTDTRIRREVVGQMFDYAANAANDWTLDRLREWFKAECAATGTDPEQALAQVLEPGEDPDVFWETVHNNLTAGRLRLVFVADYIPPPLRRIIEFLNIQMTTTEVLGIEVKQYVDSTAQRQTLVPRVLGQSEASRTVKKQASGRQWDKDTILAELKERGKAADAQTAAQLFEWVERRNDLRLWFGRGQVDGSFQAVLDDGNANLFPFALYTYGKIEIHFQYMLRQPPFDDERMRMELKRRLDQIPGVSIPAEALTTRPSIPLSALETAEALARFTDAMDWAFDQARSEGGSRDDSLGTPPVVPTEVPN